MNRLIRQRRKWLISLFPRKQHTLFLHFAFRASLRSIMPALRRFMFHSFARIPSSPRNLIQFPSNRKRGCSDLPSPYVYLSRSACNLCGPLNISDVTPASLAQENADRTHEVNCVDLAQSTRNHFLLVIDLSTPNSLLAYVSFSLPDTFSSRRTPPDT